MMPMIRSVLFCAAALLPLLLCTIVREDEFHKAPVALSYHILRFIDFSPLPNGI